MLSSSMQPHLPMPLAALVDGGDVRGDPPSDIEFADDLHPARGAGGHQVIEDLIDDLLEVGAFVPVGPQVELEGFEFEAELIGNVTDLDHREVRLARLGAEAGELRAFAIDFIVPIRLRIRKRFEALRRGCGHKDLLGRRVPL